MATINITYFASSLGALTLGDYEGKLCMMDWSYRAARKQVDTRLQQYFRADFAERETALHRSAVQQVLEYLHGSRTQFELPLVFAGTSFQQKVWHTLMEIPFGKTLSYLELSRKLGDEKAIRAVAAANGANALSIIVPCHRVIGSNGAMTGYAGGLKAKEQLLRIEGAGIQGRLF